MPETSVTAPTPPKKRIAIFLDGTWNTVGDNTNVWRLKALCAPHSADRLAQCAYYNAGLGTRFGEKYRGGMFGYGLDEAVIDAYEWLIENYNTGDEIFIFGFSRGAFTTRSLAGFVSKCGLLTPGAPLAVKQVYDRYRRGNEPRTIRGLHRDKLKNVGTFTIEEEWMLKYSLPVPIKFTGVWDTVGALGIPFHNIIPRLARPVFLDTNLRISNDYAFHALAIDEHREAFAPTLWTTSIPKQTDPTARTPRPLSQVEQRWFVGAHANVGGGCQSDLLAQIPLRWMMAKAGLHGLAFRLEVEIDAGMDKSPVSDSFGEFMYGAYKFAKLGRSYYREIGRAPEDKGTAVVHMINESIDASVFDRWRNDGAYRPKNLIRWAGIHGIDVGSLHSAVRADDPKDTIPN